MSQKPRTPQSSVQSTEIDYQLHTLGWKAFQNLCVTIMGDIWGQTVQSFCDSHDGGRDGAFRGKWVTKAGETFEGSFTAQCKFTAKPQKQLKLAELNDELLKAKKLAAQGLSDNYFLFTNARVTGTEEVKIREAFQKIDGIQHFQTFGADRISIVIRESSRLRMLVPRIYGLGDLSHIFDERAQSQATEILSALGDELAKFVITDAYQRSAKALLAHGFVLLLGEAACGKSTIAASLAVGALDEWRCSTFKVGTAEEFVAHSNPNEPKQFFWVDDAFGATQFDWSATAAWNRVFPHIHAAIRRGARVLFTSRDYIYHSARQHLKESALPVFRESQVVINVQQLQKEEREQILYNHIRLGSQPANFRTKLKPLLSDVASHGKFSPEIARRLGNPLFTKRLTVSKEGLEDFVARPVPLLCEIIRTIDVDSRSALALVFMRGGMLASPMKLTSEEKHALSLIGGTLSGVRNSLNALDGSLVLHSIQDGEHFWRFKHPTVRDACGELIGEDRELMEIYLTGAPVERLLNEVTCGDLGIEGVKVVVPKDRYDAFIERLATIDTTKHIAAWRLNRFLEVRCDCAFLQRYVKTNPQFVTNLRVAADFFASSDIDVLARLYTCGILSKSKRIAVARSLRKLAVEAPNAGFLKDNVRGLLSQVEFAATMDDVRTKLLPNLEITIERWREQYDDQGDTDPSDHFDDLVSTLKNFRDELVADSEAVELIETALTGIGDIIDQLKSDRSEQTCSEDFGAQGSQLKPADRSRSVFDDVDL